MEVNFQDMLNQVSDKVKSMANTQTVIGEEFELGKYKCKPVIKVGVGFGSGGGNGEHPKNKTQGTGGGAGAAVGVSPVGFLVADGNDIKFISSTQKGGLSTLFEKMPEMMEKAMDMKEKKEKEGKKS